MKLASLLHESPDGALIVVSSDSSRFLPARDVAPRLQTALENWTKVQPELMQIWSAVESGAGERLEDHRLAAPLPRAWQWLDGSAFDAHGDLMARLFGTVAKPPGRALMYQGMSHQFLGPSEDVPLPRESDQIDFEGEFGIITDFVPMGTCAQDASAHIKLVVLLNDWSLRALAGVEMRTGFGWVQAKPACSMAPFAVTPDALGAGWRHQRVQMRLLVERNGTRFGEPHGGEMSIGFHDLIAHAAATRNLCAGTIIGSGTVSNRDYKTTGSTCIAERRAIETLESGSAVTEYLQFGERVRMAALSETGDSPFGVMDQRIIKKEACSPETESSSQSL